MTIPKRNHSNQSTLTVAVRGIHLLVPIHQVRTLASHDRRASPGARLDEWKQWSTGADICQSRELGEVR